MHTLCGLSRTAQRDYSYYLGLRGSGEVLGVYCGSLDPDGCPARAITRVQSCSAISTAPDLHSGIRAEISRLFPDTAGEIGRAWVRIWWIACSIYFATLRAQRSRWVHNHEETTADQRMRTTTNTASTATSCSGQGTPVHRDGDDCISFRLATELFFTPVSPRPFTQYDPGRQLTTMVLERLETFQQSCKP